MISLFFNNAPGSKDSKELLKTITEVGASEVFNSLTIQNLLDYKLKKVLPIGITILVFYVLWLVFQTFYPKWYIVLIFFVLQLVQEFIQLYGEW
jgi:heme/copper-type cytochrome/quinol oxidase subunit 4